MTNQSEFQLEEAFGLIHKLVLKKNVDKNPDLPSIGNIGVIGGVLTINDEIEIVVKFMQDLNQYTKKEFESSIELVDPLTQKQ